MCKYYKTLDRHHLCASIFYLYWNLLLCYCKIRLGTYCSNLISQLWWWEAFFLVLTAKCYYMMSCIRLLFGSLMCSFLVWCCQYMQHKHFQCLYQLPTKAICIIVLSNCKMMMLFFNVCVFLRILVWVWELGCMGFNLFGKTFNYIGKYFCSSHKVVINVKRITIYLYLIRLTEKMEWVFYCIIWSYIYISILWHGMRRIPSKVETSHVSCTFELYTESSMYNNNTSVHRN